VHLPDELVSPTTALALDGVALALAGVATARMRAAPDLRGRLPLIAALAALLFALRLLRFPLVGTGACGHLGGALLAGIVVGREAGFLVVFAVHLVQALAFGDGGLLAFGVNVVNGSVWTLWVGLPLYRRLAPEGAAPARVVAAALAASLLAYQIGAVGVALSAATTEQPRFLTGRFLLLVAGAHLPLALIEGLATAAFVLVGRRVLGVRQGSEMLRDAGTAALVLLSASLFGAGVLASFASQRPEWPDWTLSEAASPPAAEPAPPAQVPPIVAGAARLQRAIAPFPRYGERDGEGGWLSQGGPAAALFGAVAAAVTALVPGVIVLRAREVRARRGGP
jgi:cobalt/nickel transport system permease protein